LDDKFSHVNYYVKNRNTEDRANNYIKVFLLVVVISGCVILIKSIPVILELVVVVLAFVFIGLGYLLDEELYEIVFDDNQRQIVLKFRGGIRNKHIRDMAVNFEDFWFSYQIEPISRYSTAKVLTICNKKAQLVKVYGNAWNEADIIAIVDEVCSHNLNGKVAEMANGISDKFVYIK
jgi:hypothetical protein